MKVDIIVPTLREKLFAALRNSIEKNVRGIDYEIFVISPFRVEGESVVWLKEDEPKGTCNAIARGYENSSGDIVVLLSDDVLVTPNWLRSIVEFIIEGERTVFPFLAGQNKNGGYFGTVYGRYYPYYPAMSRKSAEAVGGLFSREFISHFGDPDLGLRTWHKGGRAELCHGSKLIFSSIERYFSPAPKKSKSFDHDFEFFKKKWSAVYGSGWGTEFREVNRDYKLSKLVDGSYCDPTPSSDMYMEPARNEWLENPLVRKAGMYIARNSSPATLVKITEITSKVRDLYRR